MKQMLLSVRDLARTLQLSEYTIRRMIKVGKLACVRVGAGKRGSIRFDQTVIERIVTPRPDDVR
jgi:excisionase family DNA binding protein